MIVSNPEHVCFEHALEFWAGIAAAGPSPRDEHFSIRLAS
jgi:hypothetical protein